MNDDRGCEVSHWYHVPVQKILEALRKLKRNFYLVNLHFNNWSCMSKAAPLPAWAYQVLWVNKRIGIVDPAAPLPAPMSPLNAPRLADVAPLPVAHDEVAAVTIHGQKIAICWVLGG
jgi:hypothetical protein